MYGSKGGKEEEDDILLAASDPSNNQSDTVLKPSAINKKGSKEKQKSSLDLFKEELQRLNQQREEEKNKIYTTKDERSSQSPGGSSTKTQTRSQPVPIPLKPDLRASSLTLQVNPKNKSSSLGAGSFDTGDPSTTNLYVGNINPTVNENDLCDIFGKFGPLASIKIMWPRTDEERARNRNSGFVAYMSRIDADRALKALNGRNVKGYDMKLGE